MNRLMCGFDEVRVSVILGVFISSRFLWRGLLVKMSMLVCCLC